MSAYTAPRLHEEILAAGVPIVSVRIGTFGVKATYRVDPADQQAAAQPTINAFDDSPAADAVWLQQKSVKVVNASFGVRKTADQAVTSGTFVNCDDLTFTLAPSTHYKWRFAGAYTAAAATTGLQLSVNGPAAPNFLRFVGQIFTGATAIFGAGAGAYDVAIAGTASGGATPLPFAIEGTISTGAAGGSFVLRVRSEVAGSAVTILRGTIGELVVVA